MTIDNIFEEDSLIVEVSVVENGAAKDLTGAIAEASVRDPLGVVTVVTASVSDAVNGIVRVTVPKDVLLSKGSWIVQCRVELGTESRTVYSEDVLVQPSIIKDA